MIVSLAGRIATAFQACFAAASSSLATMPTAVVLLAVCLAAPTSALRADAPQAVSFDIPAIAVAEPLDPSIAPAPTTGGTLLRVRMTVSALVHPNFRGQVDEFVVEIESPTRALRVLDFWPKTEVYSQIDGTIAVENQGQKNHNVSFNVSGGYEPFARGAANGDFHSQQQTNERYQRRPPMHLLTSSGTIGRGYGVFYKFRPGAVDLEGDREIAMLVEAPAGWRADLLHVSMRAVGANSSAHAGRESRNLGSTELWTAVHRAGDAQAADAARRFVTTEQTVRRLAAANQSAIAQRSLPTMFHKVGAVLDVVEPKIPDDFLNQILFNLNPKYFDAATSRLPVDLRVAALDYWDERARLLTLASNQL
jgi:hypothetical protein